MKLVWKKRHSRLAFTLMELIIVVIIIAILAAVGLPQFFKAAGKAKEAKAKNNLGEIRRLELAAQSVTGAWSTFVATNTVALAADLDNDMVTDISISFYDVDYQYSVAGAVATATTAGAGLATPLTINLASGVTNW